MSEPSFPFTPYALPAETALPTLPDQMPNVAAALPKQTEASKAQAKSREALMAEAWDAYNDVWPNALQPDRDGRDDNVKANRCYGIVNAGIDFLFGMPLDIEVQPAKQAKTAMNTASERATAGESPQQDYARQCWGDEDDQMTLLTEVALNGALCGHAFVKILTPADTGTDACALVNLDPQQVRVITDSDNVKVVQAYTITYPTVDQQTNAQLMEQHRIVRRDPDGDAKSARNGQDRDTTWELSTWRRPVTAATLGEQAGWVQVGATTTWPYPFPPIVDCPNLPNPNDYWGRGDLTPGLIGLNKSLQYVESNTLRCTKLYAHPKLVGKGFRANQVDISPGGMIMLHNEAANLTALVTPVDIAGMRAFADDLRSNMDEISGVPAHALGGLKDLPRGQLSGVTLRALSQSTLMKTVKKRRLYGRLIREATARMLVIGGLARTVDEVRVDLHWEDPLPSDDLAGAESAAIWATLGVSEHTLMQRNGFQPEIEADKTADEAKRKLQAFSRGQGMPPVAPPPGGTPGGVPGQPSDPQPAGQTPGQTQGAA